MSKGYIYIMTKPCLKDMVKIGYATSIEERRKQLSTTALIVESDRRVSYNNENTSLSAVAGRIKGIKTIAGPSYFTYNGKLICDIAKETQWKE